MTALRRSNLCEKQYLYKLEMKGGVGDKADFLSYAGSQTTEHEDGNKKR